MTEEISQEKRIDRVWLILLVLAGGVLSCFCSESVFDISISLSGILCVGLIAIGRREGYLVGLYNSLSYAILSYRNGLYGEVYLNLLFFVPTGIIGYVMWRRHTMRDKTVEMRQLGLIHRVMVAAICMVCIAGLGAFLGLNPRQNTPYIDATTNVLSVVATFLMMWRYKEQWMLYICLNVVTIIMWFLRFKAGSESGNVMILMWSLFLLNSLFGYWRWSAGAKKGCAMEPAGQIKENVCDAA